MSGRNVVEEMRSGVRPMPQALGRGRALDLLLGLAAVVCVASLTFVSFSIWFSGGTPQLPPPVEAEGTGLPTSAQAVLVVWTKADNDACAARARAAADNPKTGNFMITNRPIASGVAGLTTMLECKLTQKVSRYCGAEGVTQLVAEVNEYFGRLDLVKGGIGLQGAPMAIAGALFGGEPQAGNDTYQDMAEDTLAFIETYSARVTAALRALGRSGVVSPDDFQSFPFAGVPEHISKIFEGTR